MREEIARAATAELAPGLKRGAFLIRFFLGLRNFIRGTPRGQLGKKPTCSSPVPNSTRAGPEKMGHACFQFRTLRGQGPKKWDMPVSSSELYAGRARKNGTCLFPAPNSTRPTRMPTRGLRGAYAKTAEQTHAIHMHCKTKSFRQYITTPSSAYARAYARKIQGRARNAYAMPPHTYAL